MSKIFGGPKEDRKFFWGGFMEGFRFHIESEDDNESYFQGRDLGEALARYILKSEKTGAESVHTEDATYFPEGGGFVVRHVFRTSTDGRRTTTYYSCRDQFQARTLVYALLR